MTTINVALVGSSGVLGHAILQKLLKSKEKYLVRVLSSRQQVINDKDGDQVDNRLISYNSDSLTISKELKNIDVIILAFSSSKSDIFETSKLFIQASIFAGVRNVLLSDFTGDIDAPNLRELIAWNGKIDVRDYIRSLQREGKINWASIANGSFLEWGIENKFAGIFWNEKRADLIDQGRHTYAISSIDTIVQAVIKVTEKLVQDKQVNRTFFIADEHVSQKQLLDIFIANTGKDGWIINNLNSKTRLEEGLKAFKAGEFRIGYIKAITSAVIGDQAKYVKVGSFEKESIRDMAELGIVPNKEVKEEFIASLT
ncbi:hypothetical protein L7F22_052799 [Adiantum nelumboides]|nr:hypothetical protein [Adiantum nelumboides]